MQIAWGMFVDCRCGARNSAFNPACVACKAPIVEDPRRKAARTPSLASFVEGAVVGRFKLTRALGSGNLGRVFVAESDQGDRVALKALHPHLLSSEDARARFVREARALREVRHPAIGGLIDAHEHDGVPVLVLELVEGVSLRQHLDTHGAMPAPMAQRVLLQMTEALHALHRAGWVHRDVKPENVMLVSPEPSSPVVRLLDFGLVRALVPSSSLDARTAAGVFVGSLAYSAPEQLLSGEIGPAVDWWALGVVAYELLTGARPFHGVTRRDIAAQVLAASPPPMAGVPAALERAVRALLAADAKDRPSYEAIRRGWLDVGLG